MPILRLWLLLVGLALAASPAAAVSASEGALLTSIVATAAAKDPMFDVLTRDDVKNALAVEADRQGLGCEESSCLAELAGAMGARIVVYGSVGQLGSELLLTLNLFDSDAGTSGGRRVVRAADVTALAGQIDATVADLLRGFVTKNGTASDARVKLLVLDLEVKATGDGPADVGAPAPAGDFPVVAALGSGVAVLGLAGVGLGIYFDQEAIRLDTAARGEDVTQKAAATLFDDSETAVGLAVVSFGVGGLVTLVGVGVAVAGLVVE